MVHYLLFFIAKYTYTIPIIYSVFIHLNVLFILFMFKICIDFYLFIIQILITDNPITH